MKRKAFPLRLSPSVYEGLRRWADDDLRSMNAQIEFLLTQALLRAGRRAKGEASGSADEPSDG